MRNNSRSNRHGNNDGGDFNLPKMPFHSSSNKFGNGRFPTKDELREYLFASPDDKASISFLHWIMLLEDESKHEYETLVDQTLTLPSRDLRRNVLAVGQIGSGKTQKVIWPMIASAITNPDQSVVVLGTKGDEFDVVKKMCAKYRPGARVVCINLSDASRTTMCWNPFACAGKPDRESEARQNGQILSEVNGVSQHDSPFWRLNAARLMAGIILGLEKEYGVATPVGLYQVLEAPDSVREKFLTHAHKQGVPFLGEFLDMRNTSNNNLQTIIVETQGDCQHLVDRNMALVTSRDEFQFDMLFDEPTVVVLETFQADLRKTRPFVNMFFAQLFDSISRKAVRCAERKLPRPLSIFLDDFAASVGYIPECAQRFNMLRSMDARVVVALQSLAQLEQYYGPGEAHAIRCACGTKIYIPQLTVGDAKIASDESGETTVGESCESGSDEKRSIGFARQDEPSKAQDANDASDPREYPRALLLDSDIRFPPEHPEYGPAATVFLPDRRPFQAWAPAAWQLPELKDFLKVDAREYSDDEALKKPQDYLAPWRDGSATCQSGSLTIDYNNMPQSAENAREEYEKIKKDYLDWPNTSGSAKKWWEAFERENYDRPQLIWRLCAELANRKATITEFFLTYVYSNTDNIQANLHYMDYSRLKKEEERKRREKIESERKHDLSFVDDEEEDRDEEGDFFKS